MYHVTNDLFANQGHLVCRLPYRLATIYRSSEAFTKFTHDVVAATCTGRPFPSVSQQPEWPPFVERRCTQRTPHTHTTIHLRSIAIPRAHAKSQYSNLRPSTIEIYLFYIVIWVTILINCRAAVQFRLASTCNGAFVRGVLASMNCTLMWPIFIWIGSTC